MPLRDVEQLGDELHIGVRRHLRIGTRRVSDTSLTRVLRHISPERAVRALHRGIKAEHRRGSLVPFRFRRGVVAIDGKGHGAVHEHAATIAHERVQRFCRSEGGEMGLFRSHLAWLVSSKATVCIHQRAIPGATNEIGAMPDMLDELFAAYRRTRLFEVVRQQRGPREADC